ncbi:MAG: hypothetical protein ACJAWW_002404 [Sulfurimonas sp.]|jgi:hypothetical protein
MFKLKNILLVMLFITSILQANTINDKINDSQLRIMTDEDLSEYQDENQQTQADSNFIQVETVNYSVHYDSKYVSFPVTVRTNKVQGTN